MFDRKIGLHCIIAWLCWGLGLLTVVLGIVLPHRGIGNACVLFVAAGSTLHVLGLIDSKIDTERRAFDLGRDAGRLEAGGVQSIR